jgi:dimethylglycine catabolism A
MSSPKLRDWFYYRGRKATGQKFRKLARPNQTVVVIGDAVIAGKSKPAITSAFDAALLNKQPA